LIDDTLTIAIPLVFYVVTSVIGYRLLIKKFDQRIQMAIDNVADALGAVFTDDKRLAKQAMSLIRKTGVETENKRDIINNMAMNILDGPKFAAIKAAAKMGLNIDIDEYIEENGAVETLQAAQSLGQMVGIDVNQLMAGGLNGANLAVGSEANGVNYYLGAR